MIHLESEDVHLSLGHKSRYLAVLLVSLCLTEHPLFSLQQTHKACIASGFLTNVSEFAHLEL